MKRILLFLFALVLPVFAYAETRYVENVLHTPHKGTVACYKEDVYEAYGQFNMMSDTKDVVPSNPMNITYDLENPDDDFSYWHFVDASSQAQYADIIFSDGEKELDPIRFYPVKDNHHYAIVTPSTWVLVDGISYSNGSGNFVLSHYGCHKAELGVIKATAEVKPFHLKITPHEVYQKTVTEYYRRYAQEYLVPVYQKELNVKEGTLVTRLTYNGTKSDSKPVNGGAFNNGHTWVKVNVKEASTENGVNYLIADSSKKTGKKTPNDYNRPLGDEFTYNVKIKDGKLTITFPKNIVDASVGVYLAATEKGFPGNAPKHYKNTVTVDLPKGIKNDTVLMYTHIEKLAWYAGENEYEFVRWEVNEDKKPTQYSEYKWYKTEYGDEEFVTSYETSVKVDDVFEGELVLTVNDEVKPLNEEFTLKPGTYIFTISDGEKMINDVSKTIEVKRGKNDTVAFDEFTYKIKNEYEKVDKIVNELPQPNVEEPGYTYLPQIKMCDEKEDTPFCEYAIRLN